ncbi:RNA 2'-phosphotransferase [Tuwongella immobilis]|uniref:Probable RNA 2'-phosphotransferase n=1 Tax=Tuwongella immobilis TaxID=692036 RepID=A0A6C2YR34_9BACT|nr:RNA 2'-phosphotransferase [Tuwongella immobilis]VIP04108.1 rna 2 -phosphotransferase : Probable RNA 2'-phosphotransferase OS=Gloeocapsa sp. PCC 73106 GN=kptA PE=3 SV=1: PTS_2-RNA [Tuwongella immobilis]VTS05583.1 rna 2 -phosphotransferase : Probable RNA 2'-phosphotransferase OS=Gloeocapsa sp. PCC 73106 GN=kptA PE=3 SV=1: PTS_2-RNA [Tuwongella immobilis]
MSNAHVSMSKFLSLVLRHQPQTIGLSLDANGWADVDELLTRANQHGKRISRELLEAIVRDNDKQRFAFNDDRTRIRANQGHSVSVDLELTPKTPPELLYHGTATRFVASIRAQGLLPRSRQQVHLSADEATAIAVGKRHGKPAVLIVAAAEMHAAGHAFFQADNGVWLTDTVPPQFLSFPAE